MGPQGSWTHNTDTDNGDYTPISHAAHFSVALSSPLHTPAGLPQTPTASSTESDPLAQESDGVVPGPNPAPKAGANEKPASKKKISHRHMNGERLLAFTR